MSANVDVLGRSGIEALRRGDPHAARAAFLGVEAAGQDDHQSRLLLAQACAMTGDLATAQRALDRVLAEEPANLYAILIRGDLLYAADDLRAAMAWYQAALSHAPRLSELPADLVAALQQAQARVMETGRSFEKHVINGLQAAGIDPGQHRAFAESLDLLMGRVPIRLQQPTSYYYPRLPHRAFFERDEFDWVPALEAAAPAVLSELRALIKDDGGIDEPYVRAEPQRPTRAHALLNDPRWSAFHLLKGGATVSANTERCPETMRALADLPMPRIEGRFPMALFSVLRGGTHIPPHHGLLNTRLIAHLPLIVPTGCRLRVGNETRTVEPGQMIIFDDSIEHEAWNDSTETRIVLLFEIWRPELSFGEKSALSALFGAIGDYGLFEQD